MSNPSYFSSDSYFPELASSRKSKTRIFLEQCRHIVRYGSPNDFYFLYGLDIKGFHNHKDFVDYSLFMRRRNEMNYSLNWYPPISILRNKALFGIIAEAYGIRTPKNLGVIEKRRIFVFKSRQTMPLSQYLEECLGECYLFVKAINGECADGVFSIVIRDGEVYYNNARVSLYSILDDNVSYILQEAIHNQALPLDLLYNKAINTLRLVTVHNQQQNTIEVLSCVLRVGCDNNVVDNWAMGGLSIGVNIEERCLREYGYYKPGFGTKTKEHPNSHIEFLGYKIPHLDEAISLAKRFHEILYGMHSIGWDIAITEEGPCFVEGNDNWEISLMQVSNYGLQKEFDRLFY